MLLLSDMSRHFSNISEEPSAAVFIIDGPFIGLQDFGVKVKTKETTGKT
jgi:hypothetical protein